MRPVTSTSRHRGYQRSLADALPREHLRPHTVRAYRHRLAAADPRFHGALDEFPLAPLG